jgi:hypothetical protein
MPVGAFDDATGRVYLPHMLMASDAPQMDEPAAGADRAATVALPIGSVASGRIERVDEVDRYKLSLRKGELVSFRVRAAALGSWLDSVLTLRDAAGNVVAENDDLGVPTIGRPQIINNTGLADNPDSRIDFEPKASGDYTLEIFDRYGDGGPEYGYRLEATAGQPDFSIAVVFGDPNLNGRILLPNAAPTARPPGSLGVLNLKPAASFALSYVISPEGNIGPISVTAESLPTGVSADVLTIRPNTPTNPNPQVRVAQTRGAISLKVQNDAPLGQGEVRIVGTAKLPSGREIHRVSTATIGVNGVPIPGTLPLTRSAPSLAVQITKGDGQIQKGNGQIQPP